MYAGLPTSTGAERAWHVGLVGCGWRSVHAASLYSYSCGVVVVSPGHGPRSLTSDREATTAAGAGSLASRDQAVT